MVFNTFDDKFSGIDEFLNMKKVKLNMFEKLCNLYKWETKVFEI